jgi:uncharacterized membrane protein
MPARSCPGELLAAAEAIRRLSDQLGARDQPAYTPLPPVTPVSPEDETFVDPGRRTPLWPWRAGTVLSILGFGASAYLTYEHYTGSKSLACPAASARGVFNCFAVTTSEWSRWYGVPVAVLGLVYFAVMVVLQSPWAWRSSTTTIRAGRIVWWTTTLDARAGTTPRRRLVALFKPASSPAPDNPG